MVSRLFGVLYAIGERWRLWITLIPAVALFCCGLMGATVWTYVDLTAALIAAVLLLDPFRLVCLAISPGTRVSVTAAMTLLLAAVQLPDVQLYFRVWTAVVAVITAAVAVLCNRRWLLTWKVRQSPHVDRVLAYLGHGGELPGAEEWERFGCREARALLHQSVNMECPEPLITSSYKAVYLLAYLHGQTRMEQTVRALRKQVQEAEALSEERRHELLNLQAMESEVPSLRSRLADERQKYGALLEEYHALREEVETARARLKQFEGGGQPEDRDSAIVAYIDAGHSYGEAAQAFGLSKSRVGVIVKEQREQEAV